MLTRPVREVMRFDQALVLTRDTSVRTAAAMMAEKSLGAVMVADDGRLLGIFTERDAVNRVIAQGMDPGSTRLGEVMTRSPHTVSPDDTYGYALVLMQEHGFRHAPVVDNGLLIGIVSARSAMDPDLEEFAAEAYRRSFIRTHPGTPELLASV